MTRPIAAFFDLDRTLIDANSGLLWALHEWRSGNIGRLQMAKAAAWTALYHLSLIDIERALDQAVAHYRGIAREQIDARTRDWFFAEVAPRLRPGAARAIARHRELGHDLVLLTNSSVFEARVASELWELDGFLANEFPTDASGNLLGTLARPLCYGDGKVVHAERWADERGIDLSRSYFYTDSYSDIPMLKRVGEPRVVSPDPRLRRAAKREGWAVLQW